MKNFNAAAAAVPILYLVFWASLFICYELHGCKLFQLIINIVSVIKSSYPLWDILNNIY